jgi:hypothetical protein
MSLITQSFVSQQSAVLSLRSSTAGLPSTGLRPGKTRRYVNDRGLETEDCGPETED